MSLKINEIRKMSSKERRQKLEELRMELLRLKMQARLGTLDNPGKIRALRKTIARILTVEKEESKKKK